MQKKTKLFPMQKKKTNGKHFGTQGKYENNIYLSSADILNCDVENTCLDRRVFLCIEDGHLF